ncbi:hypothetical protein RIF29_04090 [Crotalaria pallida]|uniref:Uncharacterized protein n=1 Tax=Crotalaria pallida TaxID=3830 RepID=A0AAN9P918_CROPI
MKSYILFVVLELRLWPGKRTADVITATLKDMWHHKLPSYGQLKKDERIPFFDRFRLYATWDPHQEVEIEKLFHKRMSSRLRGILCEARAAGRRPNWLQPNSEELGRSVYLDEVFAQTHIKLNGE